MKTNVYTTAMLGIAFAACLSACSTKSDVNDSTATVPMDNQGVTEENYNEIEYIDYIGRVSEDSKVFDGEETIPLLTNNVEEEDTFTVI